MFEPYNQNRTKQEFSAEIRLAAEADIETIADISIEREPGDRDKIINGISSYVSDQGKSFILVATIDNRVVGYGKAKFFQGEGIEFPGWYLSGLIVRPAYRNARIGSLLTSARLEHLKQHTSEVYYFANATNKVTIELHERLGFELIKEPFEFPGVIFTDGHGQLYRRKF